MFMTYRLLFSYPGSLSHYQNTVEAVKKLEAFRRYYSGKLDLEHWISTFV